MYRPEYLNEEKSHEDGNSYEYSMLEFVEAFEAATFKQDIEKHHRADDGDE
jgi:hypothetical protein